MRHFADLFERLDATTSTRNKVAAIADYLASVPAADASWAVFLLSGRRLKRRVGAAELRQWIRDYTGLEAWLFESAYAHVGDLAETVTLLLPRAGNHTRDIELSLATLMETHLLPLEGADEATRRACVTALWRDLPLSQQFVFNKMITGAFRVGVSQRLLIRALEQASGIDAKVLAHRLMGRWEPGATFYEQLVSADDGEADIARPYPFFLASPLPEDPTELGDAKAFMAEWKWDGIRAQVVRRGGQCFIWSRGEDLMAGRFPEVEAAAAALPDGSVLDGELLAWQDDGPLPFALLQQRIGRKKPGASSLAKAPVRFMAYDLLEVDAEDLRELPLEERRERLAGLLAGSDELLLSTTIEADDWQGYETLREQARGLATEGLMIKRRNSPYQVGRRRGDWWKWKVTPQTLDAVLIYAQAGHGRRSNLFTDYTFAVYDGDELVPIAKAYSGLTDAEIIELDRWIRRHTRERFGPVRAVEATWVFELAFDGIHASPRHKSGLALRFPRISRWRRDLGLADADRLEDLRRLLPTTT